jgi:RNA polymerase-associated protein
MDFEIIDVDLMNKSEDVAAINPYGKVPVLVERDLVLTEANIINEYIDERFPHPQLMPADPVMRGRARLFLHRFEQELYSHVNAIQQGGKIADKARASIRDNLTQLSQILTKQKFLLGNDFSMLDVAIAPLLWRLEYYGIHLGKEAAPLMKYAERLFSRQGFIDSLTPGERAMRK